MYESNNFLSPAKGKQQGRQSSLALLQQPIQEKENSEFKPVKHREKLTLYRSLLVRMDWVYHHHLVVPPAWISQTLSRHSTLSFIASGRSFRLHPVSSQSYCMSVRAAFAWPCEGFHRSSSLMSSSLLLQQCPTCLVRPTLIVFAMGGKRPYSCCFVGCYLQDLFNIARRILVQLPSCFFSIRLVSVHIVHPYSSIDTTAAGKKLRFILSVRSESHMTDSLSIAVHAFVSHVSMSVPVDETLVSKNYCLVWKCRLFD